MPDKKKISYTGVLLSLCSAGFLLLYLILSWYNRFAVDDYYYIHNEHLYGIWGGMSRGYYNWGGRWTSYLLWDVIYHLHDYGSIVFLYSMAVMAFYILAIYLLLLRIFDAVKIHLKKTEILNYSILFSAFTFFISFNKGEMWFWVVSTTMYIVSISSFLMGLGYVFSKKKTLSDYFAVAVCFTYAGGASEIYSVFYVLLMAIFLCLFNKDNLKIYTGDYTGKMISGLFFLSAAFIISFTAPGNEVREGWLPEPSFINAFFVTLKSLVKLILFKISYQVPWIILFSILFIYTGFRFGNPDNKNKFSNYFKLFIISGLLLVILIYFMLFPACYILSEIGPDRSLSLIVFVIGAFCAAWSFFIGYRCILKKKIISYLFRSSVAGIFVSVITTSVLQFLKVSEYASALDSRTEFLSGLQERGNKKTITVSPLPPSGFLYSAEISEDTAYFANEHYRLGLNLNFKVKK